MGIFKKYIYIISLTLFTLGHAGGGEHDELVLYTEMLNNEFLDKDKKKSIEMIQYFDTLINKMYGYEEVQIIKNIKQKFIQKYIKRAQYIDETNRNLRAILNDRRGKKIIMYEEEVNQNKNLLK